MTVGVGFSVNVFMQSFLTGASLLVF